MTGALAATMASAAFGQADPKNSAYWLEQYGTPDANVWRNSTGLCWRAGYWTPAMAIKECDPDLFPVKAPAPAPAVTPPPPPPPPPPAPAPAPTVQKITLATKALFDFDKAVLKPEGKAALDSEVIDKLKDVRNEISNSSSSPAIPTASAQAYNQRLSERAPIPCATIWSAVASHATRSRRSAWAERNRSRGVVCDQKNMKELIACLAPNRRVEVEVKGEAVKR